MLHEPVLIDTGPLIALFNQRDPFHQKCSEQVQSLPVGKVFTCWPVVVEASYILRHYPKDRERLFDALIAEEFMLIALNGIDLIGIKRILNQYQDQGIDFADGALVHLASRERIQAVFTLDHRHFRLFRHSGRKVFRLLPDLET
jgi:predicted nucleic acid-binding protein